MKKTTALGVTLLVAAIALGAPVVAAIKIAAAEAESAAIDRALGYANDALRRSEDTADQIDAGIDALLATATEGPCSSDSVELMRNIDVSSSYVQAIGYVTGDRFACSSIGGDDANVDLGPVDLVQPGGVLLRINVELPFAEGSTFLVVERDSYAAIIHMALPLDVTTEWDDLTLATLSIVDNRVLTARGEVDQAWFGGLGEAGVGTFIDDSHVVAVVASSDYFIKTLAAFPVAYLARDVSAIAKVALPIGIVAGVILGFVVIYLARLQWALPAIIRSGLKRREFFVEYQPIVDLRTRSWVGAEALIRWRRSNGELVRPDLFIPVAEEWGLIQRLTERVVELVSQDAANLFELHPDFGLSVNLSAADLADDRTATLVDRLTDATKARRDNLTVEVTERSFTNPLVAKRLIQQLRRDGVRVAIDDFGTGYSNLSLLEQLGLDCLKIDKSFVDSVGTGAATSQVVVHIIKMAKSLNLDMVAEGVETEHQARLLLDQGVVNAQGFLFARPMGMDELRAELGRQAQRQVPTARRASPDPAPALSA